MSQKTENVDAGTVGAQPTGATKKESCSPSGVADQTDALESERAERAALTSRLLASRHVCDELKADLAAMQSRLEAAEQGGVTFLHTWMNAANPMLGNVTPMQMLRLGRGDRLAAFIESTMPATAQEQKRD